MFFVDMYLKRARGMRKYMRDLGLVQPRRQPGHDRYTVVSAVYNVGKYLDEYFASLVNQELDFIRHIDVVVVDDGSTDDSATSIERWRRRYPGNIRYIHKENGGQASARNLGLQHVRTDWVTFLDPDDFVDSRFFLEADDFLHRHRNSRVKMVACNLVFYHESGKQYSDTHPLRYRFAAGEQILDHHDLKKNFQLSASSSIFSVQDIRKAGLAFDESVRPNFEDGLFIGLFLASLRQGTVGFLPKAIYYYRKREDGSSTLDSSWTHPGRYGAVLQNGYLKLLETCMRELGHVPVHVQRTIVYDMVWYVRQIVDRPDVVGFLSPEQKSRFEELVRAVFRHIDRKTIQDFELAGCWFYHKVGMLACFKGLPPQQQIAYVESFDAPKRQVQIRYFCHAQDVEIVTLDGVERIPAFAKSVGHDFVNSSFVCERRLWIHLPRDTGTLRLHVGDQQARINLAGAQHRDGVPASAIVEHFAAAAAKPDSGNAYAGAWLVMDRDIQADDNAEHFYRYLLHARPEREAYFVLRKDSHDWRRLQQDGFRLLAFGSEEHKRALRTCAKLISSHADVYVTDYLGPKTLDGKHFVFLQHGVIKDDLSGWLNRKRRIDCFVTTSRFEYESIAGDGSRYKYGRKEVVLTGLPRHDKLLSCAREDKMILIMPTWRKSVVGQSTVAGSARGLNHDFSETRFARAWGGLLRSEALRRLSEQYGYAVVFFPHANIQPYMAQFHIPAFVKVIGHAAAGIQPLLGAASLMITDYSSVAFDMAVQGKPTIYYQFDEDEIFSGLHTYAPGYFDYRRDGFGPVAVSEAALLEALGRMLASGCRPDPEVSARIDATFPFRDGRNCERTYQAVVALDQPYDEAQADPHTLRGYAAQASAGRRWRLAEQRWSALLQHDCGSMRAAARLALAQALREQGKLGRARAVIEADSAGDAIHSAPGRRERAELLTAEHDWASAAQAWQALVADDASALAGLLICHVPQRRGHEAARLLSSPAYGQLSAHMQLLCRALAHAAGGDWRQAAEALRSAMPAFSLTELRRYKPHLVLAQAYRHEKNFDRAHQQLVAYEKHTASDPACRCEIARLASVRGNWEKAARQIALAFPDIADMPLSLAVRYVQALRKSSKINSAREAVALLLPRRRDSAALRVEHAEVAMAAQRWDEAVEAWQAVQSDVEDVACRLAQAYEAGGKPEQAWKALAAPQATRARTLDEWRLVARLAPPGGERWACLMGEPGIAESLPLAFRIGNQAGVLAQQQRWPALIACLRNEIDGLADAEIKSFGLRGLLARAYRNMGDPDAAQAQLLAGERQSPGDAVCQLESAMLAFDRKSWSKAVAGFEQAFPDAAVMPEAVACAYLRALRYQNQFDKARAVLSILLAHYPDSAAMQMEDGELALARRDWERAVAVWKSLLDGPEVAPYRLARAYRMTGRVEDAMKVLRRRGVRGPNCAQEWLLRAEVAQLTRNWSEAAASWSALLRFHADEAPAHSWDQLNASNLLSAMKRA
ncbi:CDP-glycerol glycerophosphotransferase family protein [Cupriavidus sp. M-11]|uniref:CDP-glycerol glycerophosphotransferase family protein n=1 Tax=Cupriavidus sp. M-11 TaxID=3233038 RepID=UPI003F92A6CE